LEAFVAVDDHGILDKIIKKVLWPLMRPSEVKKDLNLDGLRHHNNRGANHRFKEEQMECKVESHKKHMCYLKMQGLNDCLKSVSDNPTVECRHCGAKANSMEFVCAASLEEDAPNVEGGHGTVDMGEVGMPHEGGQANKP
jgi:hypothetical protein